MKDRELDARVAREVMGLIHHSDRHPLDWTDAAGCACALPHYSTDIAAAWMVVERMRELDWELWLQSTDAGVGVYRYAAQFDGLVTTGPVCDGSEERRNLTAPEAICEAALLALAAADAAATHPAAATQIGTGGDNEGR